MLEQKSELNGAEEALQVVSRPLQSAEHHLDTGRNSESCRDLGCRRHISVTSRAIYPASSTAAAAGDNPGCQLSLRPAYWQHHQPELPTPYP